MRISNLIVFALVATTGAVGAQTHPLIGTWERLDERGRLEVMAIQEEGRGIRNKYRDDGTLRRIEVFTWKTADMGMEGGGTIKVTAEYREEGGVFVDAGEGLEVPVTYALADDGAQLTIVLGRIVTEVWARSERAVVDPEAATAVAPRGWGEIKELHQLYFNSWLSGGEN